MRHERDLKKADAESALSSADGLIRFAIPFRRAALAYRLPKLSRFVFTLPNVKLQPPCHVTWPAQSRPHRPFVVPHSKAGKKLSKLCPREFAQSMRTSHLLVTGRSQITPQAGVVVAHLQPLAWGLEAFLRFEGRRRGTYLSVFFNNLTVKLEGDDKVRWQGDFLVTRVEFFETHFRQNSCRIKLTRMGKNESRKPR